MMPLRRSFRLTISEDTGGQRVKPRVRRASAVYTLALLFLALASFPLAVAVAVVLGLAGHNNPLVRMLGVLLCFGIVIALQAVARIVLTRVFVRLGWLTPEEAAEFRRMSNKYPSSCLEPCDEAESQATGPAEAGARKDC